MGYVIYPNDIFSLFGVFLAFCFKIITNVPDVTNGPGKTFTLCNASLTAAGADSEHRGRGEQKDRGG